MCWADSGEFTGEISPLMLKEFDVDIVEIAHSERRNKMGETDITANLKILSALRHGFTPLLCVGETAEEKDMGISREILRIQLIRGLHAVSEEDVGKIMVAYEPTWAIGVAGKPSTPEYAQRMHAVLRETLLELYPRRGADIPLLFGGSVNQSNAASYAACRDIDGLFVGRAAWTVDGFKEVFELAYSAWQSKSK